jgi:hypothetical protein
VNRRSSSAAAAVAVAAALLLTACGGSSDSESGDSNKVAGADEPTNKPASPTASSSASGGTERPEITLPADVSDTFIPVKAGDRTKDAVLSDNAAFVKAMDSAIVQSEPDLPELEFYTEGEGAAAAQKWVQSFKDAGLTITGPTRYFNRKVTVSSPTTASLTYCGDESKAYNKHIKTGKVDVTKPNKDSYVAYGVRAQKNSQQVWETVSITSTRGSSVCQP